MKATHKRMKRSIASIRALLAVFDRSSAFYKGFTTRDLMERLHLDESTIRRLERMQLLRRKRGRITERSLLSLYREYPHEIPFETLDEDTMQMLVTDYRTKPKYRVCGCDGP